jgi:hypothetical protein
MTNQRLSRDISSFAAETIATPGEDAPVWSIDFTRQSPASAGLSFSRASAAGYYDASGNWVTALNNTLRVAHNPATGLPRGFLCEESRTNYLLNSNSPASQTIALAAGTYTLWLEGTGSCACTAGTAVGSGFGTATAGVPDTFTLTTGGSVTFTVSGSVSRFQCENGSFATSFITTSGSATTRAADVCSALLGSVINPTEGTFVLTSEIGQSMVLGMDNGSGGYSTRGHIKAARTERNLYINLNDIARCSYAENNTIETGTRINIALTYAASGTQCVINGKTAHTATTAANGYAITALRIGCRFLTGATAFHNAAIHKVAYYNKALPLQTLQQITY